MRRPSQRAQALASRPASKALVAVSWGCARDARAGAVCAAASRPSRKPSPPRLAQCTPAGCKVKASVPVFSVPRVRHQAGSRAALAPARPASAATAWLKAGAAPAKKATARGRFESGSNGCSAQKVTLVGAPGPAQFSDACDCSIQTERLPRPATRGSGPLPWSKKRILGLFKVAPHQSSILQPLSI